ncbi:MAG: LysE family translocator [Rhodobacteraceae bacterium]|nr:LysE family translocator [Paracoccaceae bacterium]
MENELLTALIGFALVSSITPGPNNMMLLASGANFGLRRTLPHMLGISIGHSFMVVVVGTGLIQVFNAYPLVHQVLVWLSVVYLLYLAWKIANSAPKLGTAQSVGHPFTFIQAAGFQWVNPKAWFMAITAVTAYTADQSFRSVLFVACVFALTNFPAITFWAALGQQMQRFLTNPARLRVFNIAMALLLVATLWPILQHS